MEKIKVGIVGPGTIGHKLVWALEKQDDMEFVGAAKTSPDWAARWINRKGYKMYAASKEGPSGLKDAVAKFEETLGSENVGGSIQDLLEASDVIIDCSGNKVGAKNKAEYYEPYNKKAKEKVGAIFQGGEKADVGQSFNTRTNYDLCKKLAGSDTPYLRCVSCNTTTLARFNGAIAQAGYDIDYLNVSLIRRALDPGMQGKIILDDIEVGLKLPSHHAPDLQTVMDVEAYSRSYKVQTSLMHVHDLQINFKKKAPTKEELTEVFADDNRVGMLETVSNTAELKERARRLNKLDERVCPGGDIILAIAASGSYITLQNGKQAWVTLMCPQDSIVVPENIDAVRALTYDVKPVERDASLAKTDKTIALDVMKKELEESYRTV
ncbi:MAG: type II glyceraldehyde-3-phosphate dehydrogenase [Candidatus Altiarchaeota archaeon]